MKLLKIFALSAVMAVAACTTAPASNGAPVDENQQAINLLYNSYTGLSASAKAADAALLAGKLKPADAQKASAAMHIAQSSMNSALVVLKAAQAANAASAPASGAK